MKLDNFEEYINNKILERGHGYYLGGHIEKVKELERNRYVVEIYGQGSYTVSISLNETGEILETFCSCPYDLGPYCKHEAASFYRLKDDRVRTHEQAIDQKKTNQQTSKEPELKTTLSKLKKDDLLSLVITITEEYPELEKKLLFEYAPAEDEIAESKKLIRSFINNAKRSGFIHWNEAGYALQGANTTLEKARKRQESGETESAVQLSLTVLPIVTDMLQYTDDSSGIIGDSIRESIQIIDGAVFEGIDQMEPRERTKLFNTILKAALQKRYDGWSDIRIDLLKVCIYFSNYPKHREKLHKQFDLLLENADDDPWSSRFYTEQVKQLQLNLIEKTENHEATLSFIYDNIKYPKFRERAIVHLLKEGNYDHVIKLCEEGETADSMFRGLVSNWKKYRLEAYKDLGLTEKVKELTQGFLLDGEFEYYSELKNLYETEEWDNVLEEILGTFEKQRHSSQTYVEILKEEKLYERLLKYANQRPNEIQSLYPYLIEDYFKEVNAIYQKLINLESENASDRKKYRNVCKLIKSYKKVCGEINAKKMINELEQKNVRRPAFIDELEKIK